MSPVLGIEQNVNFEYIFFTDPNTTLPRVGSVNEDGSIQPLPIICGIPTSNFYEVIEADEHGIQATENPLPASSVKILAPITSHDILCVV